MESEEPGESLVPTGPGQVPGQNMNHDPTGDMKPEEQTFITTLKPKKKLKHPRKLLKYLQRFTLTHVAVLRPYSICSYRHNFISFPLRIINTTRDNIKKYFEFIKIKKSKKSHAHKYHSLGHEAQGLDQLSPASSDPPRDAPMTSVTFVIWKWTKVRTSRTLPKAGPPSKLREQEREGPQSRS